MQLINKLVGGSVDSYDVHKTQLNDIISASADYLQIFFLNPGRMSGTNGKDVFYGPANLYHVKFKIVVFI